MSNRLIKIEKQVAAQMDTLCTAHGVVGSYHATQVLALAGLSTHPHAMARRAAMYSAHFYCVDGQFYITRMLAQFTLWHFGLLQFQNELKIGGSYE